MNILHFLTLTVENNGDFFLDLEELKDITIMQSLKSWMSLTIIDQDAESKISENVNPKIWPDVKASVTSDLFYWSETALKSAWSTTTVPVFPEYCEASAVDVRGC